MPYLCLTQRKVSCHIITTGVESLYLDVMGKVFAKVIQDRLQNVVKEVLSESQCGFRSGRGYVDCIAAGGENWRPHKICGLWTLSSMSGTLDSFAVPPVTTKITFSLHEGIKAKILK